LLPNFEKALVDLSLDQSETRVLFLRKPCGSAGQREQLCSLVRQP
jgi:hypothetical protein